MQNTLLSLAIFVVAYLWYRSDFYLPRPLRPILRSPRTLLRLSGWAVILIIALYSGGGLIGGKTQISQAAPHYARRDTQPWLYWRQIAWQLSVGLLLGGGLIRLSRATVASTRIPETQAPV